jgi:hypothetical protein
LKFQDFFWYGTVDFPVLVRYCPGMDWKEPKPKGSSRWEGVRAELAGRPGEWAVVDSDLDPNAFSYTRKRLKELGCEVTSQKNGEGLVELFARWPV